MSEETLPGGYTDGAVRIGGVVHKRASPWTPTVHALLRHLEYADVDGVPRALGFDEQGRQMLTYLPGDTVGNRTPWPAWVHSDSTLIQVGRWLRRVHDATVSFVPPADERWFIGGTVRPGLIVGHQDAAPYNAVVDGDRLVGFCDWDTAGPSSREFDLALSALWWVPLCPPSAVEPLGFHDFVGRSRRLHLLLDAYGYDADRQGFGAVVVQRARRQAAAIRQMADSGDPAGTRLLFVAEYFESAASDIEALPYEFWTPAASLCVPKTSSTSRDQAIFVDQATNTSLSADPELLKIDRFGQRFQRGCALQGAVRPVLIVVGLVLTQDLPQMGLVPDEGAVQEFASASPDPAFGDRVHAGRPDVTEHGPDPGVGEDHVERGGEVGAAVADHESDSVRLLVKVHDQVTACWAVHSPVGCRVTPRMRMRLLACSITART